MTYNVVGSIRLGVQYMTSRAGAVGAAFAPETRGQVDRPRAARGVMVRALDDRGRQNAIDRAPSSDVPADPTAMVATLEVDLGESFAPGERAAWIQAYTMLAKTLAGTHDVGEAVPDQA